MLLAVFLIVAFAACVQGISGFGFAVVSVPFLAAVAGLDQAIALSTILGLWASAATVREAHTQVRWPVVTAVLRGTAVGLPFGLLGLYLLDTRPLTIGAGVVVLALAAAVAVGLQVRCTSPVGQSATGVLSGAVGLCTGMTGPPVVIGLRGAELSPAEMRATVALTLGLTGIATLTIRSLTGHVHLDVLPLVALGIPTVLLGNAAGRRLFDRMSPRGYTVAVVTLLGLSGLVAILPR